MSLSPAEYYVLFVIGAALALIVSNRLSADLVALLVLLALGLSRIITPDQALAGFSRPAVVTLMGLFVITAGLERTGVVQWMADRLGRLSGHTERRMILVFMLAGSLLSLGLNNVAAGAVLLPAAVQVARQSDIRPSKILIPLSFGTLVGGMATLFTTANIIMSSTLQSEGQRPLTMLDFLPTGGAMVIMCVLYMLLIGRRLLPNSESLARASAARVAVHDLQETYQLGDRLWEVRLGPRSPLVGQTLGSSLIGERLGVTVVAIWHGGEAKINPLPSDRLAAHDLLLVLGRQERVQQLEAEDTYLGRQDGAFRPLHARAVHLSEVIIAPRSPVVGQTLKDLHFRAKYGLTAVAIWRGGRSYRTDVGTMPLEAGDGLLMVGRPERVHLLNEEPGYIVLGEPATPPQNPRKALLAAGIAAVVLMLSALGIVPTPEAMLTGAALLVLTHCISMEDAYRSIEWRVVFLIAGMLPIGIALTNTGLAARIGQTFAATLTPYGPVALIAGLYLFTVALTQVIGGQVSALVVGPIAISTAVQSQVNPVATAVAVAMACSVAFLTPVAHPVNVLMMSPGGYTPSDFLPVGAGMLLVCFLTLLVVLPLFWGL